MSDKYQLSFTAAEIDEKLGKIDDLVSSVDELISHVDDTNNPHSVTVEQIGAVKEADLPNIKEQLVADVISALPVYNGEVV